MSEDALNKKNVTPKPDFEKSSFYHLKSGGKKPAQHILTQPIIIHCREAFSDLFEILDKYPEVYGRFLVHCFTGGVWEMQEIVKRNGFLGVGGIITYSKNTESLREAIRLCPIQNIILETDLPFLSPGKYRSKTCLPEYIQVVAEEISTLKGVSVQEVIKNSFQNCQRLVEGNETYIT